MSVSYSGTNNYGPSNPNVTYRVVGDNSDPDPTGSLVSADNTNKNTGRSQLAVQSYMTVDQHWGGTPPAKTSHTATGSNDVW